MNSESPSCKFPSLQDSARNIRLVEILPDSAGSEVRCKFHVRSVDNCPPFVALSYTWGDPLPVKGIIVDGAPNSVRENLFLALQTLRNEDAMLPASAFRKTALKFRNNLSYWDDPRVICIIGSTKYALIRTTLPSATRKSGL
jgi:hypothetical protein